MNDPGATNNGHIENFFDVERLLCCLMMNDFQMIMMIPKKFCPCRCSYQNGS